MFRRCVAMKDFKLLCICLATGLVALPALAEEDKPDTVRDVLIAKEDGEEATFVAELKANGEVKNRREHYVFFIDIETYSGQEELVVIIPAEAFTKWGDKDADQLRFRFGHGRKVRITAKVEREKFAWSFGGNSIEKDRIRVVITDPRHLQIVK
jgi:hypothetical protein